MASLIFEQGVVEEKNDLNPVTGRWRVVYEQEGEGARFKRVLDEDEALPEEGRGLLGVVSKVFSAGADHVVYAVSKERLLALDFPRRVPHRNNVNYFDLNFRVEYHVADPRALVERLRAGREDPLARLRDAVGEEFAGACARAPWDVIRDEHAFAEMAEDLTSAGAEPVRKIQGVARYLGLAVSGVRLSLRLLEDDVQDWREATVHRRELERKRQELERLKLEEDIRDEETLRTLKRETWKGGVEALNTSVRNIGRDTDSAAKLVENLEVLGPLFFPQVKAEGRAAGALPERSPRQLAEGRNGLHGEGLPTLQRIINVIVQLDLSEGDKKSLLAAAFHLSGELLAPDADGPDALEAYRRRYEAVLDRLLDQLPEREYSVLERLLTVEHL